MQRSYKDGDRVTPDEMILLSQLKCPDCESHPVLYKGPSGGAATNYKCVEGCGAKFNLVIGGGPILWGQRISDNLKFKI